MDSVTNTSDLASQTQVSTNSLLSLLSGNGGDSEEAQLFANFMAQNQTADNDASNMAILASSPQISTVTPASTLSQSVPVAATQDSPQSMLALVKNINSTLRDIMNQLKNQNGNKSSSTSASTTSQADNSSSNASNSNETTASTTLTGSHYVKSGKNDDTTTDTNSASGTASPTPASPATPVAGVTSPANYIAIPTGASASGTTGVTTSAQPSLTELLSDLERLAQMLEKQLQSNLNGTPSVTAATAGTASFPATTAGINLSQTAAAGLVATTGNAGVAATDTNDSDATTATAPLSLAQALTDFLTLAQMAMKQLESASTGTNTSASATAELSSVTGAASSTASSNGQLMAQLKSLLNNLKTDVIANDETGSVSTLAADATASTIAGAASEAAVSNLTKSAGSPVISATKDNWIDDDNFFNIFSTHDRTTSSQTATNVAAVTTGDATEITDSKGGGSLDMDLDGQTNNNTAHNTGSLGTNAAASAALEGSAQTNPYSFASQLSASRATATMGATGLPTAVEQVILQLSRNVKSGNDQISLQLNPGDLGRVNIKLDMSSDGKVQGTVVADNPTTLGLLLKDVRSLERALQDAGLRADPGSLQFSLSNQSGNTFGQSAGNSSGQTSNGDNQSGTTTDLANNLAAVSSDTAETYYLTPNRVNLRV